MLTALTPLLPPHTQCHTCPRLRPAENTPATTANGHPRSPGPDISLAQMPGRPPGLGLDSGAPHHHLTKTDGVSFTDSLGQRLSREGISASKEEPGSDWRKSSLTVRGSPCGQAWTTAAVAVAVAVADGGSTPSTRGETRSAAARFTGTPPSPPIGLLRGWGEDASDQ